MSTEVISSLSQLPVGQSGQVTELHLGGEMRRRLQDLGVIEGTCIRCLQRSAFGDPCAYLIRGSSIALRNHDSQHIFVRRLPSLQPEQSR
jgi:ferrous iron transport protein A